MITLDHLKIFYKYGGDSDGFARMGSKKDKELMHNNYWYLIDNFQQNIELINKGLASDSFEEKVLSDLNEYVDSEVRDHLLNNKKPKSKSLFKRIFGF